MTTDRVTLKDLERIADRINRLTKSPIAPYIKDADRDGRLVAQIGNYHISEQYGGFALCRMVNEGGATVDVLGSGSVSKRELKTAMIAFICGFATAEARK